MADPLGAAVHRLHREADRRDAEASRREAGGGGQTAARWPARRDHRKETRRAGVGARGAVPNPPDRR